MAKRMKLWQKIAAVLTGVGALNWGLTTFNFNLVEAILGVSTVSKVVYWLVGASGAYTLYWIFFGKK